MSLEPTHTPDPQDNPNVRRFEDLTLAEALAQFFKAPRRTLAAFNSITTPRKRHTSAASASRGTAYLVPVAPSDDPTTDNETRAHLDMDAAIRLMFWLFGVGMVWLANRTYAARSTLEPLQLSGNGLEQGLLFFIGGMIFIALGEAYIHRARKKYQRSPLDSLEESQSNTPAPSLYSGVNIGALILAAVGAVGAYLLNSGNEFTLFGVALWFSSIGLIVYTFAPRGANLIRWTVRVWQGLSAYVRENRAAMLALALIVVFGTVARFQNLADIPPEMTSDHLEKLLDAQRVKDGAFDVFFQGNGGREPLQMYLLAAYSSLTGAPLNFDALKVLAALEGVLSLPAMFALGVTLVGDRNRRLGVWLGLAAALLMAFGYWHMAIGRVSLRIILTPLVTALLLTFLIRGMRQQSRADWVLAGLTLGIGLYTYQAVRMLPLVVIVAAALAFVTYARTLAQRRALVMNFIALVIVSFVIFVPMFRFSVEYPNDFWRRSSGRLFGDDLIVETLADGTMVERSPTIQERINAFGDNVPLLGQNLLNVVLMFNYRGDIIYLHNAAMFPAFSPLMGALFIAGVVAWLVRLIRQRDAAEALLLLSLLIMLLPSALSIANPNENPSHTRTSGAMPAAYLLAGFGLVWLTVTLRAVLAARWRTAALVGALSVSGVLFWNSDTALIRNEYRANYIASWKPLSDGGKLLRGFAESGGAYGNAFMLAYAHWWDYRIVAVEAGLTPGRWLNGDIALEQLPQRIAEAINLPEDNIGHLFPDRDLLFIYSDEDTQSAEQFAAWFPEGRESRLPTYKEDVFIRTYRVPALGNALGRWLIENGGMQ